MQVSFSATQRPVLSIMKGHRHDLNNLIEALLGMRLPMRVYSSFSKGQYVEMCTAKTESGFEVRPAVI